MHNQREAVKIGISEQLDSELFMIVNHFSNDKFANLLHKYTVKL